MITAMCYYGCCQLSDSAVVVANSMIAPQSWILYESVAVTADSTISVLETLSGIADTIVVQVPLKQWQLLIGCHHQKLIVGCQ